MIVLGIDPGIGTTGWSVLEKGSRNLTLLAAGIITTDQRAAHPHRLLQLRTEIQGLLATYVPHQVAVERLFFAKNITTAMNVSEARGVIMCELAAVNCSIHEYTPPQVKQAITGYGKATKRQVFDMLKHHLVGSKIPRQDDAADATAIAITHLTFVNTVFSPTALSLANQ